MTAAQTYLFYAAICIVCLLCAWHAERNGTRRGLVLCAVILTGVAGFRAFDVGIDTLPYKAGIEYFHTYGRVSWMTSFSHGYGVFTSLLLRIHDDYSFVLLVQAAITNGLVLARFWDLRRTCSLTCMVLTYLGTAYFVTLCITCQYVAIALVFYGSRFADTGKPVTYCLFIAAASALHTSALIAFADIAMRYCSFKGASPLGLLMRLLALVVLPVAGIAVWRTLAERYASYAENESSLGLMVFVQMAVFVVVLLVSGYFARDRARGRGAGRGSGGRIVGGRTVGGWALEGGGASGRRGPCLGAGGAGLGTRRRVRGGGRRAGSLAAAGPSDTAQDGSVRAELAHAAPYAVRLYTVGLLLSAASYVIVNAGRIAYYFTLYGAVCFGAAAKHASTSKSRLACAILIFGWLVAYGVYTYFLHEGLGIVPYSFVWC